MTREWEECLLHVLVLQTRLTIEGQCEREREGTGLWRSWRKIQPAYPRETQSVMQGQGLEELSPIMVSLSIFLNLFYFDRVI